MSNMLLLVLDQKHIIYLLQLVWLFNTAQSKCEKELLESTQKPLFGRFTPRCNPDGSYHLIQCHPSTGFCWCSNPDGTKYPGTEVRGKPECEKYKSLPVASTLFAAVTGELKNGRKYTNRKLVNQLDRQTDRQTNKQKNRQTDKYHYNYKTTAI